MPLRAPVWGVRAGPGLCELRGKSAGAGQRAAAWGLRVSHISSMHPKPFPPTAKDVRRFPPPWKPLSSQLAPVYLSRGDNLFPAAVLGPYEKSVQFKELLTAAHIPDSGV